MNLIKIGRYIADKRKALGLTQRQLAEMLGMSDKSVSKWERGICLPDVSVYADLCGLLGISINEFLAGEDIVKEEAVQKSEENLFNVTRDNEARRKKLKLIIYALLIISIAAASFVGIMIFRSAMPKNFIAPVDSNSIEMKTARLLSGSDAAFIYKYAATDDFESLMLYISEYRDGTLVSKEESEIAFGDSGSPKSGQLLIIPDFENFTVQIVAADDTSQLRTSVPILENVENREYYGRSATQIEEETPIRYGEEQNLVALIYDDDEMSVGSIHDFDQEAVYAENDYMYCFSVRFCK